MPGLSPEKIQVHWSGGWWEREAVEVTGLNEMCFFCALFVSWHMESSSCFMLWWVIWKEQRQMSLPFQVLTLLQSDSQLVISWGWALAMKLSLAEINTPPSMANWCKGFFSPKAQVPVSKEYFFFTPDCYFHKVVEIIVKSDLFFFWYWYLWPKVY